MTLPKKRNLAIIAVIILAIAVVLSSLGYIIFQVPSPKDVDSIVIGNAQSFECDTLVYIAQ